MTDAQAAATPTDEALVFTQWSKYEDIAMHFNDLIMRWRLQAIGGLAALVTLGGSVVGSVSNFEQRYWAMILLATTFISVWAGLGVLDLFYYRKLLAGAVQELLGFEARSAVNGHPVRMSTTIENLAKRGGECGPWVFYIFGAIPLFVILGYATWKLHHPPPTGETSDKESCCVAGAMCCVRTSDPRIPARR